LRFIHDVALQHTGDECLFWPFGKNRDGYGQLTIDGKKVGAHRYICELAHGAPPTTEHQSAHSCGKGDEGCISQVHLSWKTPIENKADELLHGTRIRGERHVSAKLTEAAAREIINLKSAEPQRKLAERFRVSQMTISRIQSGRKWAHLSPTNTTLDEQERGDAA
jgi:hypothetical protein